MRALEFPPKRTHPTPEPAAPCDSCRAAQRAKCAQDATACLAFDEFVVAATWRAGDLGRDLRRLTEPRRYGGPTTEVAAELEVHARFADEHELSAHERVALGVEISRGDARLRLSAIASALRVNVATLSKARRKATRTNACVDPVTHSEPGGPVGVEPDDVLAA